MPEDKDRIAEVEVEAEMKEEAKREKDELKRITKAEPLGYAFKERDNPNTRNGPILSKRPGRVPDDSELILVFAVK